MVVKCNETTTQFVLNGKTHGHKVSRTMAVLQSFNGEMRGPRVGTYFLWDELFNCTLSPFHIILFFFFFQGKRLLRAAAVARLLCKYAVPLVNA